jgi:four helix bundle protein
MVYSFEKLEVWQKSRVLMKSIYITTKNFPSEERFGMTSQLRRASVSVSSNIAEGSVRWSKKEQARFYEISYGSLMEVLNQLILSHDLEFLKEKSLMELRTQIDEVARMVNALYYAAKKDSA